MAKLNCVLSPNASATVAILAHEYVPHMPGQYMDSDVIMFEDDYAEPRPVIAGYPHMAHQDYVEALVQNQNVQRNSSITSQAPVNLDQPRFVAIPGNLIAFNAPGIGEIPYNPNEPYFNSRPQVLPDDALTIDGVIPYDPKAPYFNAGPQDGFTGIHYPIIDINPLQNAPPAVVDDPFSGTNANVPLTGNALFPQNKRFSCVAQDELFHAQNYSVRPRVPQQLMVPVIAREVEQVVEAGRRGDRAELFAGLFGDDKEEEKRKKMDLLMHWNRCGVATVLFGNLAETKITNTMKTN